MTSGDKRYTPNFNLDQIDQKLYSILTRKIYFNKRKTNEFSFFLFF
jgi:hypothetical protein